MIVLKNFEKTDALALHERKYADASLGQIENDIDCWNQKQVNGKYFEMLGIWQDGTLVGMISLYQLASEAVSIGPEIFRDYRRNGFAKAAMRQACALAKEKGYQIISQQIRTDNCASIALHTSLGFETDGQVYTNAKGKQVCVYLKSLM